MLHTSLIIHSPTKRRSPHNIKERWALSPPTGTASTLAGRDANIAASKATLTRGGTSRARSVHGGATNTKLLRLGYGIASNTRTSLSGHHHIIVHIF